APNISSEPEAHALNSFTPFRRFPEGRFWFLETSAGRQLERRHAARARRRTRQRFQVVSRAPPATRGNRSTTARLLRTTDLCRAGCRPAVVLDRARRTGRIHRTEWRRQVDDVEDAGRNTPSGCRPGARTRICSGAAAPGACFSHRNRVRPALSALVPV